MFVIVNYPAGVKDKISFLAFPDGVFRGFTFVTHAWNATMFSSHEAAQIVRDSISSKYCDNPYYHFAVVAV